MSDWKILAGDCVEQMRTLPDASIDAVVCDPPYGIGFMGHEWDQPGEFGPVKANGTPGVHRRGPGRGAERADQPISAGSMEAGRYDLSLTANRRFQGWCEAWATECFRVLKPGGHLLSFCGTRTYHRMASGVEDAGFEIRDSVMWMYGSGFPKSLDVSKAIDKTARAKREVVGKYTMPADSTAPGASPSQGLGYGSTSEDGVGRPVTAPATARAREWQGWGTALKPAHDPIVVARKPLISTVAANVLEHGTGALNVDGCRIGSESTERNRTDDDFGLINDDGWEPTPGTNGSAAGRWPANVVLDEDAAAELDAQTGEIKSGFMAGGTEREGLGYNGALGDTVRNDTYGDSGGASRFFYCAKTSRAERNAGLDSFPDTVGGFRSENSGQHLTRRDGGDPAPTKNGHSTVKPIELMRWLVRLVTPPGGTVLDPFLGSGSTGCAAVLEGFDFIGCEREDGTEKDDGTRREPYVDIARARITFWAKHEGEDVAKVLKLNAKSVREKTTKADVGQLGIEFQTSLLDDLL